MRKTRMPRDRWPRRDTPQRTAAQYVLYGEPPDNRQLLQHLERALSEAVRLGRRELAQELTAQAAAERKRSDRR